MSIILEALKKASVNRNAHTISATAIIRQEENAGMRKTETLDGNSFSMSRTMLMAVCTIAIVGIVAFLTSNVERETTVPKQNVKPIAEGYAPPVQVPAATAPKQEMTSINSFIARLSNPHLTLNGIVYGIGKPAAIIENKILEEGNSIKGAKVIKIHSDRVEMVDEVTGQNFVLKVD